MSIYADPHDSTVARYAPALLAAAATYPGDLVARHTLPSGPGSPAPGGDDATVELAPVAAWLANGAPATDTYADSEPVVQVGDPLAMSTWQGDPAVTDWQLAGDPGDLSWPSIVTGIHDAATAGRVAASLMRTLAGAR